MLEDFEGDIHEGDVFAINDPYRGGTHFPDFSLIRPVFSDGELIALAQANGHWADVGGSVPGSFDVGATDHFGEGIRVPPIRVVDRGTPRDDVIGMIASNSRAPGDIVGDCHAQIEATRVAEQELFRLIDKYGRDDVVEAFGNVQDYVERLTRARISDLPDGTWETTDHIDFDPGGEEGLVTIRVKLTISGDEIEYDLSGSDPVIKSFLNSGAGVAFSGAIASAKTAIRRALPQPTRLHTYCLLAKLELNPLSCQSPSLQPNVSMLSLVPSVNFVTTMQMLSPPDARATSRGRTGGCVFIKADSGSLICTRTDEPPP